MRTPAFHKTSLGRPMMYADKAIQDTLRLADGSRKVSFRYDLLNRNDITIGELDGILSANISYGEFRVVKRSATFKLNEHLQKNINYLADQIQPWFVLHMPDDGVVEWPLGIFLLESPAREVSGKIATRDIGAYDKTIIVEQDKFTRRFFLEKGTNYATAVTRILNTAGITKIDIAKTAHTLPSDREYSLGTKKHLACNELLREINFTTLWVDELGVMRSEPYIPPSQREVTHIYNTGEDSIVTPKINERLDIADRPNVFIRVAVNLDGDRELISTFVNDNVQSPISTVNRGRQIVDHAEIQDIASQEALDDFVRRLAIESTSAFTHLSFGTALIPTHGGAETLYCNFPEAFDGAKKFHETSWEMPLVHNGTMRHEARMVVQI